MVEKADSREAKKDIKARQHLFKIDAVFVYSIPDRNPVDAELSGLPAWVIALCRQ